jgi:ribosomal protein S12 methylthiotransferase
MENVFNRGSSFKIVSDIQEQAEPEFNGCGLSNLVFTRFMKFLLLNGYHVNTDPDFFIVSSCSVTKGSMFLTERTVKHLYETTDKKIILYGCFVGVKLPVDVHERLHFVSGRTFEDANNLFEHDPSLCIENITIGVDDEILHEGIETSGLDRRDVSYQQYDISNKHQVLVSRGCNYNCTYCNIKASVGNPKSIPIETILNTIKKLLGITDVRVLEKTETVYLTSDDPGSYGADIGTNIVELIDSIIDLDPNITIAIFNLYPKTLLTYQKQFYQYVSDKKIVYLMVPLQTGSDRVLKLMGRAQTKVNVIVKILEEYKRLNPKLWLYTHMMFSFPSETREELLKTLMVSTIFDDTLFTEYSDVDTVASTKLPGHLDDRTRKSRMAMVRGFSKINKRSTVTSDYDVIRMSV